MSALVRWRRTVAAVQLAVAVLAMLECSSWQVQAGNPVVVLAERHPSQVRVTRSNGEPMVIKLPAVVGDSIIGRAGAVAVADVTATAPEVQPLPDARLGGRDGGRDRVDLRPLGLL